MQETINLVGYGVDTLIINVRYSDSKGQPVKQELNEKLVQELDYLQGEARRVETAVATNWAFQDVLLFVEPHGAGKQWRWLLTSRLLNIAVSRGKFNDIIAQVRFSSEYLWSQDWCGDVLSKVHTFLMSIFGEFIHLQLSEVHLRVDIVGYDFSQCNYETQFVTRVRKNEAFYGADSVSLDCHRVSMLAFSKHKAPISCGIYKEAEPKTQNSRRSIVLTTRAVEALEAHRCQQEEVRAKVGDAWQEHDYVFCTPIGTHLSPGHNGLVQLKGLLEKAGLPDIRFHDLRHSAATLLLSEGVHPKVVQEILGHSEIGMTMNTYSHVLPTMQKDAMSRLDNLF